MFFLTKTKHLEIIKMVFSQLSSFATIITAGLGLLFISHHIRNRTTKMVFTKPCPPEIWLLSGFFSASIVSLAFYVVIFLICTKLFFVLGIPYQLGIFYFIFNEFFQAIILLSYVILLTVLFHPVIAVLFVFIFQDGTFYYVKLLLMSGIKATGESSVSPFLKLIKGFVDIIYLILPTFKPFSEETSHIYSSLRISDANWAYFLLTFAYTLSISALFYFLSAYFLKKKRHI
jgi:ABC-type transport system involved in multi-copper enzyme maturation permease subunit